MSTGEFAAVLIVWFTTFIMLVERTSSIEYELREIRRIMESKGKE